MEPKESSQHVSLRRLFVDGFVHHIRTCRTRLDSLTNGVACTTADSSQKLYSLAHLCDSYARSDPVSSKGYARARNELVIRQTSENVSMLSLSVAAERKEEQQEDNRAKEAQAPANDPFQRGRPAHRVPDQFAVGVVVFDLHGGRNLEGISWSFYGLFCLRWAYCFQYSLMYL